MKLNLSKFVGRLGAKSVLALIGLLLAQGFALGQIPYTNFSGTYIFLGAGNPANTIPAPPQVDATSFYNSGYWDIVTAPNPYQTTRTLNYTNVGTMIGQVGWEFDYGPLSGGRSWSANFVNNSSSAIIQAEDGTFSVPPNNPFPTTVSYLLVSATNIVNKGVLLADPNGEIVLNGSTVNLSRGQLLITNVLAGGGSVNGTTLTFGLDVGLYAVAWAQTNVPANNLPANSGTLSLPPMDSGPAFWNGNSNSVTTPVYAERDNCSTNFFTGPTLSFTPTVAASRHFILDPTNEFRQVVFVNVGDTNIVPSIRFTPSSNPTNHFQTVAVRLTATLTNPFTLLPQTNALYIVDTLGSETNLGFYTNTTPNSAYTCSGPTLQPANYIVSRSDQVLPLTGLRAFGNGTTGVVGNPSSDFIWNSGMITESVSNFYSAYSVFDDDLAADSANATATNLPGRIQINANTLDLTRTWLGAQGSILIQASNLVNSAGAVVDCQNLSYNLGSTNGFLNVTNLAKQYVARLRGTLNLWSAIWTNGVLTADSTGTNYFTNNIIIAVTIVDASGLSPTVPVTVQNLALHSTNSTISDSLTVDQSLLIDGQNFTLLGQLFLSGALQDWTGALAPGLLDFTNDGYLYIPNIAHFGDDTAAPYTEFVNNGQIQAGSVTIRSLDFQNSSANGGFNYIYTPSGSFSATVQSAELTGGIYPVYIFSGGDIQFSANTLLLNNAYLNASDALNFYVTNSLSDNGTASTLYSYNGFNLGIKPQTGDLLGSTLVSVASGNNAEVDSTWAGQDRGPSWTGFTDNVAVGTLALVAQNYLAPYPPLFVFSGTSGSNAMYVMTLDLSQLTTTAANLAEMIQINPGMKIYVSQVILGFTPPGGQTPLAFLESQFPGQITNVTITITNTVVAQSGTVNWTNVHQQIDGFGACSAFASTMTSAQAATLFGTNNGQMGLSLWRVRIDETGAWSTETTNAAFAHQYGAKVLGSPWWAPSAWTNTDGSLLPSHYADYANWLSNAAVSINLDYVSIQNEPDYGIYGGWMNWSSTQIFNFMKTNAPAIGKPIVMPESYQFNDAYSDPVINDPAAVNNFAILGGHIYGGGNYVHTNALAHGKPVWMTEHFNQLGSSQTSWATTNILCAVYFAWEIGQCMNNQMSAYIWWRTIHSPYAYDDLIVGATPDVTGYAVAQYARFIRPGYVRIDVSTSSSNLFVTAFKATNSQNFAIVAVNTNIMVDVSNTFTLANFPAVSSVTPWITSASMSLSGQAPVAVSGSSFTYTVPAQSVVTFVGQGSGPSSISISSVSHPPGGNSFVLTWNSTASATYSVLRTTNGFGVASTNWPVLISGYPTGGAAGGSLSYTDTTATVSPAFYRVRSP